MARKYLCDKCGHEVASFHQLTRYELRRSETGSNSAIDCGELCLSCVRDLRVMVAKWADTTVVQDEAGVTS